MEKRKKHISPTRVLGSLFLLSAQSLFFAIYPFAIKKSDAFSVVTIITVFALYVLSIVFAILSGTRKNLKYGDEYTTKIMQRAAFWTFRIMLAIMTLTILAIFFAAQKKVGFDGDINEAFKLRTILSIFAGVQLLATFLFSLLIFVFSKRGAADGV